VKISDGIPIAFKNGDKAFEIISEAPEAVNIPTPTIKAHNVGSRLIADKAPSLAPFKKEEK
jgi:hypothetical protein